MTIGCSMLAASLLATAHFASRAQQLETALSAAHSGSGATAPDAPQPVPPDLAFVTELHESDDDLPEEDKRQYDTAREYLLAVDQSMRFDASTRQSMTANERRADQALAALRASEMNSYRSGNSFPPANAFYRGRAAIDQSEILRILKKMPKGGALHLHASSAGRAETILKMTRLEECLVEVLRDGQAIDLTGRLALPSEHNPAPEHYEPAATIRETLGTDAFDALLIDRLTMSLQDELSRNVWQAFSSSFQPYGAALAYERAFELYFLDAFEQLIADNVDYVELRTGIADVLNRDGSISDTVETMWKLRNTIRQTHPDFDVKLIICSWRGTASAGPEQTEQRTAAVREALQAAMQKRKSYADFIVGFDLVGHEDGGRNTASFRDVFLDIPAYRHEYGVDMSLMFHDGESVWADDMNVVDAYLVGAKRIGHGLNLYLFPTLLERLIQRDIAMEICPISNQILGFVRDLRTHPAIHYMRRGVPIVLSSDDPAIFGYTGLSYDYWIAYMAWDLDLASLKQLAQNSITYSAMSAAEKQRALARWERKWATFIDELLADPAFAAKPG